MLLPGVLRRRLYLSVPSETSVFSRRVRKGTRVTGLVRLWGPVECAGITCRERGFQQRSRRGRGVRRGRLPGGVVYERLVGEVSVEAA